QRALGLFINTLPLRVRLGARGVLACVKETHEALTQLLHHEHANLSLAQRCSALPGGTPLFSALLNYRYSPEPEAGEEQKASIAWEGMEVLGGEERTNYPFVMSVDDLGKGFELVAQISERVDAQRVCGYMHSTLRGVVEVLEARSEQLASDVQVISGQELSQLAAWSWNQRSHGDAEPVHRLIERQAQQHPEAPALVFGEETLSYGELNARANRLAHRLMAQGVGPEVLVGIAVERSVEMVVGILGIVKAGGAYVPLDPEYPGDRLAYMVEDSGIGMLLTQSHLRSLIPGAEALRILDLDTLDLSGEPDSNPEVELHGEHLAYVIYTSGSTGRPKGAANRHRSLHNRLAWMQQAYELGATDTVLQKTPFSFDVSVWEFFWPLMYGAKLVVAHPGDHRDPQRLVELIGRQQVNTLHFVPSMLQAFLAYEGAKTCTSLKRIVCSGEALPAEARDKVFARLPQAKLYNLYGPTEAAIDVTHWTCRDDGSSQVPIGRPISQTQAYVLDGSLNEVPAGVAGELYLGGINLARGYLKRAGLTAERFIATDNGSRLYRTGDLVRWNNEGQLEYLGRIDHQVKVRGFRIELGEIEAGLQAQEEVREAVVVANEGPAGTRLVAYVSGQGIDTAVLKQKLGEALPDYMVPSVIVELQALPLNANGKVDRKALPAPEFTSDRAYEAPVGEVEETLAAIWAEVLGVTRVGRNDNFFELGGHSLLAAQTVARVQSAMQMDLAIRDVFLHPVLTEMGTLIADKNLMKPATQALSEIDSLLDSMEAV
ncbi:amino acid adenylation domain-containing protein, partial [Variovorax atrisoli]|uniref:amino acid adenylation domain-containing protein n=3 Tax=Variovorax TaxID=34072 RepID=UPI003396A8F9